MFSTQNSTIYIKNLPEYNDQVIYHFCGNFGKILDHRFINTTDPNKKDAIVHYELAQAAFNARQALNGRIVKNLKLHVDFARPEPSQVPNNRDLQENNRRFPTPERMGNPMAINPQPNFRDFDPRREERPPVGILQNGFAGFGEKLNMQNNPMQFNPRMPGPFDGLMNGIRPGFNMGMGLNAPPMQFQQMNHGPQGHPMGLHGPLGPNGNQFRPIINQNPMMQRPAGNFFIPPQQGKIHPVKFEQDPRGPVPVPHQAQAHAIQRPSGPESALAEALAQNPALQSHANNPDLVKTLIDVFRKEVSALVGVQANNNQEKDQRRPSERESSRVRSRSRNRKDHKSRSPRRRHNSDKKKDLRSRSRSNSYDSGYKGYSSKSKHSNGKLSKSEKKRDSRSRSRSESKSDKGRRSESRGRYSSSPASECGEIKVKSHHKKKSHKEHRSKKHSHKDRSRSKERVKKSHRRGENEGKNRSRSRSKDSGRKHSRKHRHRSRSQTRESGLKEMSKEDYVNENNPFVIEDDAPVKTKPVELTPLAKKETLDYSNIMNTIVLEDQDLSQATTLDSLNIEKTSSHDSSKLLKNALHQVMLQEHKIEEVKKNVKGEVELKYPHLDGLFSASKYTKDKTSAKNRGERASEGKKENGKRKFVYSSLLEENKESNYPFNTDYNWALAAVLGMYPDDLKSLNFQQNLKSNVERLLMAPESCQLEVYTAKKGSKEVQEVQEVQEIQEMEEVKENKEKEESEGSEENEDSDMEVDKVTIIISETEEEKEERRLESKKNAKNEEVDCMVVEKKCVIEVVKPVVENVIDVDDYDQERKIKKIYTKVEKTYEEVEMMKSKKDSWILTIQRNDDKGNSKMREENGGKREIYEIRMEENFVSREVQHRANNYASKGLVNNYGNYFATGSELDYLKEKLRLKHPSK